MITFCEECGEKHIIEQEIDPVKGLAFQCQKCGFPIKVMPRPAEPTKKVEK